jgi:hypothetical protein
MRISLSYGVDRYGIPHKANRGIGSINATARKFRAHPDKVEDDYNYVDEAFKAKYPPLPGCVPTSLGPSSHSKRPSSSRKVYSDREVCPPNSIFG